MNATQKRLFFFALVALNILCTFWYARSDLPVMLANDRDRANAETPTSAEVLFGTPEAFDDKYLTIQGLEIVGEPMEMKRSSLEFCDFVLVQVAAEDGKSDVVNTIDNPAKTLMIFCRREPTEQSIANMIRQNELSGEFFSSDTAYISPEDNKTLESHFPGIDLASTRLVLFHHPRPLWMSWIPCIFLVIQPIGILWLYYVLFMQPSKLLNDDSWEQKIGDDRTMAYRSSQRAMRLISHETYSNGSLQERIVDTTYDVPAVKKTSYRKAKQAGLLIAGILANGLIGGGIAYLQFTSDFIAGFGKLGGQLLFLIPMVVIGSLFGVLIRKSVVGQKEEESVPLTKASYRKLGFYKYNARILAELGFVEVGDYKLNGGQTHSTRTIFLSPKGNLLVQLGVAHWRPFFSLSTLTNSGKLLETNSLTVPSRAKTDESRAHLCQSASHLDIVKALEDHDELVAKTTFTGAIQEAKFSATNFGRFLAFSTQ